MVICFLNPTDPLGCLPEQQFRPQHRNPNSAPGYKAWTRPMLKFTEWGVFYHTPSVSQSPDTLVLQMWLHISDLETC